MRWSDHSSEVGVICPDGGTLELSLTNNTDIPKLEPHVSRSEQTGERKWETKYLRKTGLK